MRVRPLNCATIRLALAGTLNDAGYLIAGIGFTMAIFVSELAFGGTPLLAVAKVAVLAGSVVAVVLALVYGRQARL